MNEPVHLLVPGLTAPAGEEWEHRPQPSTLPDAQWEIIRFCVQAMRALGMPRSSGEIFGYVFTSAKPVTFDEIVSVLGISKGSASQGLRYLRRIGVLDVTYVARDRRDHFVAEKSLERLVSGYFMENVSHYLGDHTERLRQLRANSLAHPEPGHEHLPDRLKTLAEWLQQAGRALQAAAETFQTPIIGSSPIQT